MPDEDLPKSIDEMTNAELVQEYRRRNGVNPPSSARTKAQLLQLLKGHPLPSPPPTAIGGEPPEQDTPPAEEPEEAGQTMRQAAQEKRVENKTSRRLEQINAMMRRDALNQGLLAIKHVVAQDQEIAEELDLTPEKVEAVRRKVLSR